MSSGMIKKTLYIDNMTCASCESRIERELGKLSGVGEVSASYVSGAVIISYEDGVIGIEQIEATLEGIDYHVRKAERSSQISFDDNKGKRADEFMKEKKEPRDYSNITGVAIILFAIYIIAWKFGILDMFKRFPVATEGMGYGMLFVIGLLTSVHCVAMCGGICLSQSIPKAGAIGNQNNRLSAIKPSLLYNIGRVISYTVIGGVVGALGSVVSFSGMMRGIVLLLAGIFMVIMGINMLGFFPWLRRFNPRMPKVFANKINASRNGHGPLYIGLLNGLMPCGPLQAMQLYALSTGSPLKGALAMFLFSVGTVPLLFAFGAVSTFLNKKFTKKMMTASAALVVILGIYMLGNGLSLSGIILPSVTSQAGTIKTATIAEIKDNEQVVTTGISSGKYEPIVVQKGIPVKWTIQAEAGDLNGCNNRILVQKYGIEQSLVTGDNVIEFTPTESGEVSFSCWMGMIRSKIVVVDDLNNTDSSTITDDSTQSSGSGGCCGSSASGSESSAAGSGSNINFDQTIIKDKKIPTEKLAVAKMEDNIQYVEITYGKDGFSPAVVVIQKDLKTKWVIKGDKVDSNASTILFPNYSAELQIAEGENPITFIPSKDFDFYTSDGSYLGYVKVVDDINKIDKAAIQEEVQAYNPVQ
jgi:uncharacterized protein